MRRPQLLLVLAALLFAVSTSGAVGFGASFFYRGNQLWDSCKGNSRDPVCQGYVAGVADAMTLNDGWVGGWRACFPTHATRDQITDVAEQWLQSHPEERAYGAPALVSEALAQAFPCPH